MIINEKDYAEYKAIYCDCGCSNEIIMKSEKGKDGGVFISLMGNNIYFGLGRFRIIREKIIRAVVGVMFFR